MYAIRYNEVKEIEYIAKDTKRGNGCWVLFKGYKKLKIVSKSNIFNTYEEAKREIESKQCLKLEKEYKKNEKLEKETREIDEVLNKIWKEFKVEIPLFNRPIFIKDAWQLYHVIKGNNSLRDMKLI